MKTIGKILIVLFGSAIIIQVFPYGRNHINPPVIAEPSWNSPQTRSLTVRACMDCHSNETVWPWYSNIAPASWLVQHDTDEARERLNFSEWGQRAQEIDEIYEVINSGDMPPFQFLIMHPEARLTDAEKQTLIQGLQATLGQ